MSLRSVLVLATVAVAAAGAFTPAAQARVWTVGGTGADYSDIQPAIDAAADGDLVLIRTGGYPDVTIDNKALTLVAEPGQGVQTGEIRIVNLAAGKTVVVGGFQASGSEAALSAENNMGSVRIEGMILRGTYEVDALGAILTNNASVAFRGCSIFGGGGGRVLDGNSVLPASAMVARGSLVALYDCRLTGGEGFNGCCCVCHDPGGPGGHGLESDGFVFASGCQFVGGRGGYGGVSPPNPITGPGGPGGNGILVLAGLAELLDCITVGGAGGYGNPDGVPGQPTIGAVNQIPGASRHLGAPIAAWDCASVALTFHGQPGDQVTLLTSPAPGFRFSNEDRGVYLVSEPPAQQIAMGTVLESGQLVAQLPLDPLTGPNAVLYVQARMDSSGQVTLGSPASLVRWASPPPSACHCGQPVLYTGQQGVWKATDVAPAATWLSDPAYDDANWSEPVVVGTDPFPPIPPASGVWTSGPLCGPGPATTVWFRVKLTLEQLPTIAEIEAAVDDDFDVYVNGALVITDHDCWANASPITDVTANLRVGENLIAIQAHDCQGCRNLQFVLRTCGAQTTLDVSAGGGPVPALTRMLEASPNPSRGPTQIDFHLLKRSSVEFQMFDPLGRRVDGIPARVWEVGAGRVEWSGTTSAGARLSSGLYFVRMLVDGRPTAATRVLRLE